MEDLENILEKIKEEERSLRDLKVVDETSNGKIISGADVKKTFKYAPVVSFLIYAKYSNVFDFKEISDVIDIPISLSRSQHHNADKLLKLWNEIGSDYPYTLDLIEILNQYDLSKFCTNQNDTIISEFVNNQILFAGLDNWFLSPSYNISTALGIIDTCTFQFGIENKESDVILVSAESAEFILSILNKCRNRKYVFSSCGLLNLYIRVAIGFLNCYKACQYIEGEGSKLFPFESAKFNGIYYLRQKSEKSIMLLDELMNFVKEDGFCIAFNQPKDRVNETFIKCEIPLLLDVLHYLIVVARNKKDELGFVRYGSFYVNDSYSEAEYWKDLLVSVIKTNGYNDYYQAIPKDDFRYASNKIDFRSIRREKDQLSFVWRDLKDIISQPDDEEIIHNVKARITKVLRISDLSSNPFNVRADFSKYTNYFDNNALVPNHIVEECEISRLDDFSYNFTIPKKYEEKFYETFINNNKPEPDVDTEPQELERLLCCRLVTKPSILYGWDNSILRVDASKERPVCIEKYYFICEESEGYAWQCNAGVDVINISSEYDENFVIYQLINCNNHKGHILVAPSKEEQRTYFLNKRLEYLSTYQPVVDEIEEEIKHAIAVSDSTISGVGFKNFRRFSRLDSLHLSGVNILVGGNNAGKSTFVKGMLLALDNIKSFTPQNIKSIAGGRILYFQLDANNFHDVHVGTFNRAYSRNAVAFDEDNFRKICFEIRISNFVIEIVICPNANEDLTSIPVGSICVKDEKRKANFIFDYIHDTTTMEYEIASERYIKKFRLHPLWNNGINTNIIASLIREIANYISTPQQDGEDEDWNNLQSLKGKTGFLIEISSELDGILSNTQVEYIYAHGINQKILFNYNDKNDFMAVTLHDLMNENISDEEETFICNWMEEFGIGKKYEISSIGGEAYSIQIKNMNDEVVYLADMGMGASQLLVLIFRIAIIIHRQRMKGNTPYRPTIIIEEPEQNMHPAYQSKLAVLFNDVYEKYGFSFIVETHSEYLVRKSQVIVARKQYKSKKSLNKNNPFKVYYFPTVGNPYEMEYRLDGNFSNDFGTGFYDEANNLLFEII